MTSAKGAIQDEVFRFCPFCGMQNDERFNCGKPIYCDPKHNGCAQGYKVYAVRGTPDPEPDESDE